MRNNISKICLLFNGLLLPVCVILWPIFVVFLKNEIFLIKVVKFDFLINFSMISYSFSHKGDLEQYTHATYEDFSRLIKSIWKTLVDKGFS